MIEPVGDKGPFFPSLEQLDIKQLSNQLTSHTKKFIDLVQQLLLQPQLVDHKDFLQGLAQTIQDLNPLSLQAKNLKS
ncbi:MAG: hypothetical protein L0207_00285 [Chlamydiae bacterium]|nr:hypothetical protein [Chlamydiota bacterium]